MLINDVHQLPFEKDLIEVLFSKVGMQLTLFLNRVPI